MTFFNDPVPQSAFAPPFPPNVRLVVGTVPFVMTGFATIGGTTYDLAGQGIVIETFCNCALPLSSVVVSYQFAEPSPLYASSLRDVSGSAIRSSVITSTLSERHPLARPYFDRAPQPWKDVQIRTSSSPSPTQPDAQRGSS
jgi:hypothetical protein